MGFLVLYVSTALSLNMVFDPSLYPMWLPQIAAIKELIVVFLKLKYPFQKRCDVYLWLFANKLKKALFYSSFRITAVF